MHPIVNGLKREYAGRVTFVQVNVLDAENEPLLQQYGFSSTPEIYLTGADGTVLAFWDAVEDAEEIRVEIDRALGH